MPLLTILLLVILETVPVKAERFDDFLKSLDTNLPISTGFMQSVLKSYQTKLARPSLLEKWGVINTDAAATYNGILNTIVLKEEYTLESTSPAGGKNRRIKTLTELKAIEPVVWSVRAQTIFHELSHAEFGWLPRSQDSDDKSLLHFFNHDFENYLKLHQTQFSRMDRVIARSEMFAYFRGDILMLLIEAVEAVLVENGYFGSSKQCKNTKFVIATLQALPREQWFDFVLMGRNDDYTKMQLPSIYVKGKDGQVDPKDPLAAALQRVLWAQLAKHFMPARTKAELVQWMNTSPELRRLIGSCRSALLSTTP